MWSLLSFPNIQLLSDLELYVPTLPAKAVGGERERLARGRRFSYPPDPKKKKKVIFFYNLIL